MKQMYVSKATGAWVARNDNQFFTFSKDGQLLCMTLVYSEALQKADGITFAKPLSMEVTMRGNDKLLSAKRRESVDPIDKPSTLWSELKDSAHTRMLYEFSKEFDGKSVLALLQVKSKMTYDEVLTVIKCEGGYVDEQGIVHSK